MFPEPLHLPFRSPRLEAAAPKRFLTELFVDTPDLEGSGCLISFSLTCLLLALLPRNSLTMATSPSSAKSQTEPFGCDIDITDAAECAIGDVFLVEDFALSVAVEAAQQLEISKGQLEDRLFILGTSYP